MTFWIWPVRTNSSCFDPWSMIVASTVRTSPPCSDTETPVAAPTWSSFSASPYSNRSGPRYLSRSSGLTSIVSALPSAIVRATLRLIVPISRSRLRTPASRVYSRTSLRMVSLPITSLPCSRPCCFALTRECGVAGWCAEWGLVRLHIWRAGQEYGFGAAGGHLEGRASGLGGWAGDAELKERRWGWPGEVDDCIFAVVWDN